MQRVCAIQSVAQRMTLRQADHLLTVQETADRLAQSSVTVRRKIRLGEIPAVRLGARARAFLRVDERALNEWLARNEPTESPASAPRITREVAVEPQAHSGEAA